MKTIKNITSKLLAILVMILTVYYVLTGEIDLEEVEKSTIQPRKVNVQETIKETDTNLKVYFIDVGQADCILIEKNGEYALIDAGNNRDGKKLVNYFNELGIVEFKYVIGTHPHEDHIGGMDNIINSFNIKHYLMPDVITTTPTFEDVLTSLESKKIKYEVPKINSTFNLADATFTTIFIDKNEDDLNNSSIVLKLTYKNISYLFMADAEKQVEQQILDKDIKSTVLKVGHHGTKYATTNEFLNKVQPEYSIISVGKNNDYGLPKQETLNRIRNKSSKIYRTDTRGTIISTTDGEGIIFETVKTDTNGD